VLCIKKKKQKKTKNFTARTNLSNFSSEFVAIPRGRNYFRFNVWCNWIGQWSIRTYSLQRVHVPRHVWVLESFV